MVNDRSIHRSALWAIVVAFATPGCNAILGNTSGYLVDDEDGGVDFDGASPPLPDASMGNLDAPRGDGVVPPDVDVITDTPRTETTPPPADGNPPIGQPDATPDRSFDSPVTPTDGPIVDMGRLDVSNDATPPNDARDAVTDPIVTKDGDACILNACNGCGVLSDTPGGACGACGTLLCSADGSKLECSDPGYNECGGCNPLVNKPGQHCQHCGTYVCNGTRNVTCQNPTAVVVEQLVTGGNHVCQVSQSGGMRCWGENRNGELGDGTVGGNQPRVPTKDILTGVKAAAAGEFHTCALMQSGGVRCWGHNLYGQLGDGTTIDRSTPPSTDVVTGVRAISARGDTTCVVMESGSVRCWGDNGDGQVGDGTTSTPRTTPTGDILTGVSAVSVGYAHTCALMTTGGVRCWGAGTLGQLGDGLQMNRSTPGTDDILTGVAEVSAGTDFTCARMNTGTVRCWGDTSYGQLGNGSASGLVLSPGPEFLTNVKAIATAVYFACAIYEDGTPGNVTCWGRNYAGQVGDKTMMDRYSPTGPVVGIGAATYIALGNHTSFIYDKSYNLPLGWGGGDYGQFGDGDTSTRLSVGQLGAYCP
jgi:alpha-tubulin suppressor-like RCC1 family protein